MRLAFIVINHNASVSYDLSILNTVKKSLQKLGYKTLCLVNTEATKLAVLSRLKSISKTIKKSDRFIFYFSGHTIWSPWKKGLNFFDFKPYHIFYDGKSNWMSNDELMDIVKSILCKKILLFDTCCGPLIGINKQKNTQIVTVSNKFGRTISLLEKKEPIPIIAYYLKKIASSPKNKLKDLWNPQNHIVNGIRMTITGKKMII